MTMRNKTTRILILATTLLAIAGAVTGVWLVFNKKTSKPTSTYSDPVSQRAAEVLEYAKKHILNTNDVLLVDYSIPSGTTRMLVWSHKEGRIVAKTYVMHGVGGGSTAEKPVFSDRVGSKCSTLGKFKVTKHYGGKIKRSYRLVGLERGNKNAFRRRILIHSSSWIDMWRWKKYIPLHEISCQGCVTVSPKEMTYLDKLIKKESMPILILIYIQ